MRSFTWTARRSAETFPSRSGRVEFKGLRIDEVSHRPPGARDVHQRLADLDDEGIWGELTFPSLGMWAALLKDRELVREGAKALNDWALSELQGTSPGSSPRRRSRCSMPMMRWPSSSVARRPATTQRSFRPCLPQGRPVWNDDTWDPLWAAAEETGMRIAFHIGTDGENVVFHGRGGAILNFAETTYGGQRAVSQLIASGVFDRQPDLKVLVSEGGATWVPFLGDRMNEMVRQQPMYIWPKLKMLPKEYMNRNVYASFQHDETAIPTYTALGYKTSCSAATTPTWRARTGTPRTRSTSSSTTYPTTCATASPLAPSSSCFPTSANRRRRRPRRPPS